MPEWNPFQIGMLVGVLCGAMWSTRTVYKQYHIAGPFMLVETRFWRSLLINFTIPFALGGLVSSLLAGALWLLRYALSVVFF